MSGSKGERAGGGGFFSRALGGSATAVLSTLELDLCPALSRRPLPGSLVEEGWEGGALISSSSVSNWTERAGE